MLGILSIHCHSLFFPCLTSNGTVSHDFIRFEALEAQWFSGRVLGLKLRGCRFEPHWGHYIVYLSTLYPLLSTGSTQEDPYPHDLLV